MRDQNVQFLCLDQFLSNYNLYFMIFYIISPTLFDGCASSWDIGSVRHCMGDLIIHVDHCYHYFMGH